MAKEIKKNFVIPKELLVQFKNEVRLLSKYPINGIRPMDFRKIVGLNPAIIKLLNEKNVMKEYDLGLIYEGKSFEKDLEKLGIEFTKERLVKNKFINGIPVPYNLLKTASKFKAILVSKG